MKILVTGGAGYIGSHTLVELIDAGYEVVAVDNLCNSQKHSLKRVEKITHGNIAFYQIDIRDKEALTQVFKHHKIDAVMHFAGLKAVDKSVQKPIEYYDNNIGGTLALVEVMQNFNCKILVFSSSATVYGDAHKMPIREDFPLSATNPYGYSKLMIEQLLQDVFQAGGGWSIAKLRYFNPIGAHKSGTIGEHPNGIPNNLMPHILRVAMGELDKLNIFGGDYNTPDGTAIRDYIHVVDLAKGHIQALHALIDKPQIITANLGTGNGYSVLDMVMAFEKASGKPVPYQITHRRKGDIAICYADPSYAYKKLNWKAKHGLKDMCQDAWRWQVKNPDGYLC